MSDYDPGGDPRDRLTRRADGLLLIHGRTTDYVVAPTDDPTGFGGLRGLDESIRTCVPADRDLLLDARSYLAAELTEVTRQP